MVALNFILGMLGFFGWLYIWVGSKYQTGSCGRIQLGVGMLGFVWLSLIVADTLEGLEPEAGTVLARVILLAALWCLKPLLERGKN